LNFLQPQNDRENLCQNSDDVSKSAGSRRQSDMPLLTIQNHTVDEFSPTMIFDRSVSWAFLVADHQQNDEILFRLKK